MSLAEYSVKQLEEEIERRKTKFPDELEEIDLTRLLHCCKAHLEDIQRDGYVDEDSEHYIFEAALVTFYGKDIFDWINANID